MNTAELMRKAKRLAEVDYEINGCYANQPYAICHNDELFKAYVRTVLPGGVDGSESSTYLDVVRPAANVASEHLPKAAPDKTEQVGKARIRSRPSDDEFRKPD